MASTVLVDLEVYDPSGNKVFQKFWDRQPLSANAVKSLTTSFHIAKTAQKGLWTVKVGVFSPGWASLLGWSNGATTFAVR